MHLSENYCKFDFFEQFEWYFWNFSPKIFRSALSSVRSFPTLIKVKAPTTSSSRRILKNVFLQKIRSGSWMHLQLPERPICQMSGLFPVIRFHQIWLQKFSKTVKIRTRQSWPIKNQWQAGQKKRSDPLNLLDRSHRGERKFYDLATVQAKKMNRMKSHPQQIQVTNKLKFINITNAFFH